MRAGRDPHRDCPLLLFYHVPHSIGNLNSRHYGTTAVMAVVATVGVLVPVRDACVGVASQTERMYGGKDRSATRLTMVFVEQQRQKDTDDGDRTRVDENPVGCIRKKHSVHRSACRIIVIFMGSFDADNDCNCVGNRADASATVTTAN